MPASRTRNITKARRNGNRPAGGLRDTGRAGLAWATDRSLMDNRALALVSDRRAAQAQGGGETRQTDLREQVAVDEEDGYLLAVAAGELRVRVHVHLFPLALDVGEDLLDLAAHLFAEVATGTGEQAQPRQGAAAFFETR